MLQRIKFYLKPLVNEILDQLPPDVFTRDDTTFLDPALGGGQFLREVIKRLRAVGHSDENIKNRIWGCEIRELRLKYAVRFGGVISDHLITTDFLSHDWGNMKFDVILGNPPYQAPKKGDYSYWARFVHKSNLMLNPHGWNAMIIPCGWMSPTNDIRQGRISILKHVFAAQHTPHINVNPSLGQKYFPGVGQRFSYFITQKSPHVGATMIDTGVHKIPVDLKHMCMLPQIIDHVSMSIIQKISSSPQKWNFVRSNSCDYSDVKLDKPHKHYPYKRINGNTNHLKSSVFTKSKCEYQDHRKVVLPYMGTHYKFVVDNGSQGVTNCYVMLLNKTDHIKSAKTYFGHDLIKWLGKNKFTQYNEGALIECVGSMDLSKPITNQDVYDHYGITQTEIDYIQKQISGGL